MNLRSFLASIASFFSFLPFAGRAAVLKPRQVVQFGSSALDAMICEAIGEASMCWKPIQAQSEFDSSAAVDVAKRLSAQVRAHFLGRNDVATALDVLRDRLKNDPDYAWSWHCKIAMATVDEGGDHAAANRGAARFLGLLFPGVDTTKHPAYANTQTHRGV